MGAEGSIVIMSRALWDEHTGSKAPDDYGLYAGSMLGIEAVWDYVTRRAYRWVRRSHTNERTNNDTA